MVLQVVDREHLDAVGEGLPWGPFAQPPGARLDGLARGVVCEVLTASKSGFKSRARIAHGGFHVLSLKVQSVGAGKDLKCGDLQMQVAGRLTAFREMSLHSLTQAPQLWRVDL